jgi:C1A family cysteine protease
MDLRSLCPPVYDQGQLGSCTANAIGAALEFDRRKQGLADFVPSRLFIYYNERVIEGDPQADNGAQIRDGIKSVAAQGVCFEQGANAWPYDIAKFADAPPAACYTAAEANQVLKYARVTHHVQQMKGCLAAERPFVFGFTVYDYFESQEMAQSGVLQMPAAGEKVVGGHAVMAVGYDDSTQMFIVRNSWGPDWGQKGYFMMPYAYLTDANLADDLWTIKMVEA